MAFTVELLSQLEDRFHILAMLVNPINDSAAKKTVFVV